MPRSCNDGLDNRVLIDLLPITQVGLCCTQGGGGVIVRKQVSGIDHDLPQGLQKRTIQLFVTAGTVHLEESRKVVGNIRGYLSSIPSRDLRFCSATHDADESRFLNCLLVVDEGMHDLPQTLLPTFLYCLLNCLAVVVFDQAVDADSWVINSQLKNEESAVTRSISVLSRERIRKRLRTFLKSNRSSGNSRQ